MIIGLSDNIGNNNNLPNQRVSLKTKQTAKWTKSMADYVVNLAVSCNDKSKTREFLDMANGHVNKDMYEYVIKTYGVTGSDIQKEKLIDDLREIDFLQPIKDIYLGEFVNSYNNYQVYTDDPDTIFLRNKAFGDKVIGIMNQQLINELNKTMPTGQPTKETPDIAEMLEQHIADWNDERAAKAQLRLNLLNNVIDAKVKYNQLYYYWWATEECYTYRTVHKNDVIFEVVPPYEYFRVPSDNTYVEDDHYGARIFKRNLYTILDRLSDYLTPADITYLRTITDQSVSQDVHVNLLKSRMIENGMSESDYLDNNNQFRDSLLNDSLCNNAGDISVAHYIAKTEVKVGYLTFISPEGEVQETTVDEDYELDLEAGDVSIKWDWIQQIYQGEIIGYGQGSSSQAVYTKFRPIDIQREKFSNLNVSKSPYNGLSYIHKDSERKPIPYRVNPYLALIRIYYYQIEKAINKWKSILAIPQSLLTDDPLMKMEERLSKLESSSLLIFNDTNINANAIQAMKEVATSSTFNYVNTLMSLVASLKVDAKEVANMTPSRMGNQKAYQGKSVTENSLEQASTASNWGLEMFNLLRARDYLANYDYSKVAWAEGKQGSFTDESTNEHITVAVDPMEHMSLNIGINVGNSRLLDEKLKAMKDVAFSAAQNGDFEMATEAILNDNLQALRHKVLDISKATKLYNQQMKDAENQATVQAEQIKSDTEHFKAENKLAEIQATNDGAIQKALIDQQTQLLVWDKRLSVDANGNGYVDDVEAAGGALMENYYKQEAIQIKRQELALKTKKVNSDIQKSKVTSK